MVCKENVVSWFRNLSSHKRIDLMCTLLNMCLPFEVRYLGTYIEDRGKRDYNDLRDVEYRANHTADLNEILSIGMSDTRTRRRLILYMALLQGSNHTCATIIYKILAKLDSQGITSILNGTSSNNHNEQPLDELLLLYTMALTHPAFSYEQRITLGDIFEKLNAEERRIISAKEGPVHNRTTEAANEISQPIQPPSSMQPYPDVQMRSPMMTGCPPGLTMPPPGLCMPPGSEQMSMGGSNPQYLPLGFPSTVSPMAHWPNQTVVMTHMNQMVYPSEMSGYPTSPLVSRQSSPSQSRSPSRSNSPMSRRNNSSSQQRWNTFEGKEAANQQNISPLATTTSTSQASSCVSTSSSSSHLPPNRSTNQRISSTTTYTRHNSADSVNATTSTDKPNKQPPPPRLRTSVSGDTIRENKDLPNFKGNLQNYSREEIRRLSDEDLRDIGLTPNAVGQLRNIVRSQTMNGLSNQVPDEKQESSPHHGESQTSESSDVPQNCDVVDMKTSPQPPMSEMYPPMMQHNNHQPHMGAMRRCYPTMPPLDPTQISMYTAPPPALYPPQNSCYACLTTGPMAGMQVRYPRCSAQHMYCLSQLQNLRLDENSRQCSQSSSSDSTGSRSPPITPPAVPWSGNPNTSSVFCSTTTTHSITTSAAISSAAQTTTTVVSTTTTPPISTETYSMEQQQQQQQQQQNTMMVSHIQPMNERPRHRRNHMMRHNKNQMMNGGPPPINMGPCVSAFPVSGPSVHSQMTFLPHGHVPLRPNTGLYPNFSGYRPNYPATYQPNGEIMFPYPPPSATGGTPPPSTMPPSTVTVVVPTAQTYMAPPAPVVPFTATVQQAKISCCNCGSNSHLAIDCKDQTMDDLTKRAPYRLDYTPSKPPADSPSDK